MEIITQKSLTAKIRPIFVVTSTQGSSHACVSTIYPALTKETIVDVCSQIVSDSSPTQCTQIDVCSRCQELWLYQHMDQNTFPFQWTRPHLNKPMQNQERKYHDMHSIALAISNSVIPYFSIHTFSLNIHSLHPHKYTYNLCCPLDALMPCTYFTDIRHTFNNFLSTQWINTREACLQCWYTGAMVLLHWHEIRIQ